MRSARSGAVATPVCCFRSFVNTHAGDLLCAKYPLRKSATQIEPKVLGGSQFVYVSLENDKVICLRLIHANSGQFARELQQMHTFEAGMSSKITVMSVRNRAIYQGHHDGTLSAISMDQALYVFKQPVHTKEVTALWVGQTRASQARPSDSDKDDSTHMRLNRMVIISGGEDGSVIRSEIYLKNETEGDTDQAGDCGGHVLRTSILHRNPGVRVNCMVVLEDSSYQFTVIFGDNSGRIWAVDAETCERPWGSRGNFQIFFNIHEQVVSKGVRQTDMEPVAGEDENRVSEAAITLTRQAWDSATEVLEQHKDGAHDFLHEFVVQHGLMSKIGVVCLTVEYKPPRSQYEKDVANDDGGQQGQLSSAISSSHDFIFYGTYKGHVGAISRVTGQPNAAGLGHAKLHDSPVQILFAKRDKIRDLVLISVSSGKITATWVAPRELAHKSEWVANVQTKNHKRDDLISIGDTKWDFKALTYSSDNGGSIDCAAYHDCSKEGSAEVGLIVFCTTAHQVMAIDAEHGIVLFDWAVPSLVSSKQGMHIFPALNRSELQEEEEEASQNTSLACRRLLCGDRTDYLKYTDGLVHYARERKWLKSPKIYFKTSQGVGTESMGPAYSAKVSCLLAHSELICCLLRRYGSTWCMHRLSLCKKRCGNDTNCCKAREV